jgi:hypothetical protein
MTIHPSDLRLTSDAQLIERSRKGDQNAFGQIVERYQSLVCSVAYNRCGDLTLSEDLGQEAFLLATAGVVAGLSGLMSKTRQAFWLSGLLVISWPSALAIRATDWIVLVAVLAVVTAISLFASWFSLRYSERSHLSYSLGNAAIVLVGIAAMTWRRLVWTPDVSDFAWFFIAISGMATTAAVLNVLVWKRIYGKRETTLPVDGE